MLHQIPNIITSSRIVLAAAFPFCPEQYHLSIVALALVSEFLDGFIARIFNWQSYVGQVLDPIADKLFVLSVSLTWVWLAKLTIWQWLLLAVRDIGVAILFLIVLLRAQVFNVRAVAARLPSKITTAIQYLAFIAVLFNYPLLLEPLVLAAAVIGVVAVVQYTLLLRYPAPADEKF